MRHEESGANGDPPAGSPRLLPLRAVVADRANQLVARRHVPTATYRLQLHPGFPFQAARELVPYLHELGISDLYSSPFLKARPGSTHGYDVCDHGELNPELGGRDEFEVLSAALQEHGMGLLLDMVPNHMGIGEPCNGWWMDVLENGPGSIYAPYFDIDWHPVNPGLANKLLLPILEDQYGKVLEGGKLRLAYEDGSFVLLYYDRRLPLDPRSFARILSHRLDMLVEALGDDDENVQELQSILTALSYLPDVLEIAPEKVSERYREKEVVKRRIASLHQASVAVRDAIDTSVESFNGTAGDPRSFDALDALIGDQSYRLAFWRVATEEINFRRFFDINELAAIRVEEPQVFEATHRLVLELLAAGKVTGLRIDHPDGLWDPPGYFRQLQESYVRARLQAESKQVDSPLADIEADELADAVEAWAITNTMLTEISTTAWPLYVVVEKILSEREPLPADWAVDGTTGYDFLNLANGLFVDSRNRDACDAAYRTFTGINVDFGNLVNSTKKMIMLVSLASELNSLSQQLDRIAEKHRWYRDFTLNALTFALREIIASLAIYRTYTTGGEAPPSERDRQYVEEAVADAKRRNPRTAASIFDFIGDTLLLRNVEDFPEEDRPQLVAWVMRFQQVTGPVMAKGVEDTAFYVFNRLISLNEVGGHPEQFGVSIAEFHEQTTDHQTRWPHSLLATATHDTKRGEDTRARIDVLSELPDEWQIALARWSAFNLAKKTIVDGEPAPDRNDEYLLYQTLVGAWPEEVAARSTLESFQDRVAAYVQKAIKEAKVHTSWINPNDAYDAAIHDFVARILEADGENPFLAEVEPFAHRVASYGRYNSLAQTLLKLTAPGVPDLYQGTELWDLSLVDPDNRRPVDYEQRHARLAELRERTAGPAADLRALAEELLASAADGRIKLYVIQRALGFRRDRPDLFAEGSYVPLRADGPLAEHVCAFARVQGDTQAIVVVPRLLVSLTQGVERPPLGPDIWGDTLLRLDGLGAGASYHNLLTGESLSPRSSADPGLFLREVLAHFPVALLVADSRDG